MTALVVLFGRYSSWRARQNFVLPLRRRIKHKKKNSTQTRRSERVQTFVGGIIYLTVWTALKIIIPSIGQSPLCFSRFLSMSVIRVDDVVAGSSYRFCPGAPYYWPRAPLPWRREGRAVFPFLGRNVLSRIRHQLDSCLLPHPTCIPPPRMPAGAER